ncbi:MAG: hypothetical protein HUU21_09520 [Polyangiaceae bacterium]|nr:hypothetical protein [Polyangiaceae bacterium]
MYAEAHVDNGMPGSDSEWSMDEPDEEADQAESEAEPGDSSEAEENTISTGEFWRKKYEQRQARRKQIEAEQKRCRERAAVHATALAATAYRNGGRVMLDVSVLLGELIRSTYTWLFIDQPPLPSGPAPTTFERRRLCRLRDVFAKSETSRFDDAVAYLELDRSRGGARQLCFQWNRGRSWLRLDPSNTYTYDHVVVPLPDELIEAADRQEPTLWTVPPHKHGSIDSLRSKSWWREQQRRGARAPSGVADAGAALFAALGKTGQPHPEASVARLKSGLCPLCLGLAPISAPPRPSIAVTRPERQPNSDFSARARKAWETRRRKAAGLP